MIISHDHIETVTHTHTHTHTHIHTDGWIKKSVCVFVCGDHRAYPAMGVRDSEAHSIFSFFACTCAPVPSSAALPGPERPGPGPIQQMRDGSLLAPNPQPCVRIS